MIEEIWYVVVSCAPSVAAVLASVISALLAIKKVATTISEFRQSNELKENNEQIKQLLADNKSLKKLNEKLLVELTKIKPKEWTDDEHQN